MAKNEFGRKWIIENSIEISEINPKVAFMIRLKKQSSSSGHGLKSRLSIMKERFSREN